MMAIFNYGVMARFASDMTPIAEVPYTIVFDGGQFGSWGRGQDVNEAVCNYLDNGGGMSGSVLVCRVDMGAYCDDFGGLKYEHRSTVYAGIIVVRRAGRHDVSIQREAQAK